MSESGSEYDEDFEEVDKNYIGDYVGERSPDGKRHGFGRAILPNRDQYEGDYRNGLRHGRGCYIFNKNGARYDGEWKKGSKHGHGKFYYPDGSVYCGEWKENKKHGYGKYSYDNGDVYEGNWKENYKNGIGTYKFKESGATLFGTFVKGSPRGPIQITYPNNMRYYGYYKDNHAIAEGVFTFDMKYMQHGHIEMIQEPKSPTNLPNPPTDNEVVEMKSSDENSIQVAEPKCTPHFITHEITKYIYTRLPQHPIPPPQSDSSKSSVCSKVSSSSEIEVHLYQVHSPIFVAADDCEGE